MEALLCTPDRNGVFFKAVVFGNCIGCHPRTKHDYYICEVPNIQDLEEHKANFRQKLI
jgi:hypothetical protein